MAKPLIVLNRKGIGEMLKSSGVRADLERRVRAIAAVAGEGMEPASDIGKTRARASVVTTTLQAKANEAQHRSLTRALDAGRG